jgi:predicted DNA-binding antitoxin AbrB/MazE fold protein
MFKTVKAKFIDGALVPLETLDLNEGDEVLIILDIKAAISLEELTERSKAAAGGWMGSIDPEQMLEDIYTSRHRGLDCDCKYCAPER